MRSGHLSVLLPFIFVPPLAPLPLPSSFKVNQTSSGTNCLEHYSLKGLGTHLISSWPWRTTDPNSNCLCYQAQLRCVRWFMTTDNFTKLLLWSPQSINRRRRSRLHPAEDRMNSLYTQGVRQTSSIQAGLDRMRAGDSSAALQGAF